MSVNSVSLTAVTGCNNNSVDMDILNELFGPSWGVRDTTDIISASSNSSANSNSSLSSSRLSGDTVDTTTPTSSTPTPTPTSRPPSSADKKSNSIKGKGECLPKIFVLFFNINI